MAHALPHRAVRGALIAGTVLGAALIISAARGDLWLDEILSLAFAETAKTPWELFTVYKNDNNHLLNTLYLYAVGRQETLPVYRLFSVFSGIASLLVLIVLAKRRGPREGLTALLLAGASYPLVLYFSEARGYAPAIFFSLLSLLIFQTSPRGFTLWRAVLFWLVALLGILSHLTFGIILGSLVPFFIVQKRYEQASVKELAVQGCAYFAVPLLLSAAFYLFFARAMVIGGGDAGGIVAEISRGAAALLGLPGGLMPGMLPLLPALAVIGASVYIFYRERNPLWVFCLSAFLLLPAAVLVVQRPEYFHFRYFIVCFPFFYLLAAFLLGELFRSSRPLYRYAAVALIGLFLWGQAERLLPLLQLGRGSYRPIVAEMARATAGNIITVGSDHDFRNRLVLSFYARSLPRPKVFYYVERPSLAIEKPEWIVTHSLEVPYTPQPYLVIAEGQLYALVKAEPYPGTSGFGWFLYRRMSGPGHAQ